MAADGLVGIFTHLGRYMSYLPLPLGYLKKRPKPAARAQCLFPSRSVRGTSPAGHSHGSPLTWAKMNRFVLPSLLLVALMVTSCATRLTEKTTLEHYLSIVAPVGANVSAAQAVIREHHWKILSFTGCDISSKPEEEPKFLAVSTTQDASGCFIVWTIEPNDTISEIEVTEPEKTKHNPAVRASGNR